MLDYLQLKLVLGSVLDCLQRTLVLGSGNVRQNLQLAFAIKTSIEGTSDVG
jgi:hypothetical protein